MPTEKQQQEHGLYSFDGHKFTKLEVSDGKRIPVSDEGFEAVKAMRKELATIVHRVTYTQLIDRACRFLLTKTFDYNFGIPAGLI